jgi:hypothetical protein
MPERVILVMAEAAVQKENANVETSRNGSVRRRYHGFGVRRLQKSVCASKAMPADDRGVGGIRQEDSARSCAAEMDALATCSHSCEPPASS